MKFDIWVFFENTSRKFKFHYNQKRIVNTLHENVCTHTTVSRIIIRIKNVSDESCTENQNTHFIFSNLFPRIVPFMSWCGKIWYSRTAHRWQYNTAHVLLKLGNEGNTHTLRMCNTHYFPTASNVTTRPLSVMLIRMIPLFLNECLISNIETCRRKL